MAQNNVFLSNILNLVTPSTNGNNKACFYCKVRLTRTGYLKAKSCSGRGGGKKNDNIPLIGSLTAYIETRLQHSSFQAQEKVMATETTETTEVAKPFVNPWHPNAIPPIDPRDPRIINPTGEFGPHSYIDTGAYSPVKYPSLKKSFKRSKKKQDKNGKKKKLSCIEMRL